MTIHIFGASSLFYTIENLNGGLLKRREYLTASKGLSIIAHSKNNIQKQLKLKKFEGVRNLRILIWHDVINNSLSRHPSNHNRPLSPEQLITAIRNLPCQIQGVIYCEREGCPEVFEILQANFTTVHAVRHTFSRRKLTATLIQEYRQLHPPIPLEEKNYLLITRYINNLQRFQIKKKRKNNKQRRSAYRRSLQATSQTEH